jgi:hypothetical protein
MQFILRLKSWNIYLIVNPSSTDNSANRKINIFKEKNISKYKITSSGDLYIPDSLSVRPSMKIDHKLINSFFQMSNVDGQYIEFSVKMKAMTFTIISSSCIYPLIIASSTLLSFDRESTTPNSLSIDNLNFSSFSTFLNDFETLEIGKEYLISMKHEDNRYYKFFYLICPFYQDENMDTVIRMASILSTEEIDIIDLENNNKYPVEFNSTLSSETFIGNALLNIQVKKVYIENLFNENDTNTLNIDFSTASKYLLIVNKPQYLFKISTTKPIYYKVFKSASNKGIHLIENQKENPLNYSITSSDIHYDIKIYIENISLIPEVNVLVETFSLIKPSKVSFFYNFWGYFIVILASLIAIIIIWIIIQRMMNKKRLKKIQEELDMKLREQHTQEIQKQSEKLSIILMASNKGKITVKLF